MKSFILEYINIFSLKLIIFDFSMDIEYFYTGLILGVSIAAPVGPIGILCIKRTLASGRVVGLTTGIGAATADALYGGVAAFGLTFISTFLIQQQIWLRLVGGLFLCYLGVKTIFSLPANTADSQVSSGLLGAYASAFFLTITNPLTILSFAAIFAGVGLINVDISYQTSGITVFGVFLGSSAWWLFLSSFTSLFRQKINLAGLMWINRISGLVIFIFGLIAIIGIFSFKPVELFGNFIMR